MNHDAQHGLRLKEERERIGRTQQEIALDVGVRREMWAKYEAGAEPGAAALSAMVRIGLDVIYILTGQRNPDVPALSRRALTHAEKFESLTEDDKKSLERTASALAQSVVEEAPSRPSSREFTHAPDRGSRPRGLGEKAQIQTTDKTRTKK